MKKECGIFTICVMIFTLTTGFAQVKTANTQAGIYKTFDDLQHKRFIYTLDCSNTADKLKLNGLFGWDKAIIVSHGKKYQFRKSEVYGYTDCSNEKYRFFNYETYKIIDTTGFFLYYHYKPLQGGKGNTIVNGNDFYFSAKGDGDIMPLTLVNLEKTFPGNLKFRYALVAQFRSDKDLVAYDQFTKEYRLEYLYQQSLL